MGCSQKTVLVIITLSQISLAQDSRAEFADTSRVKRLPTPSLYKLAAADQIKAKSRLKSLYGLFFFFIMLILKAPEHQQKLLINGKKALQFIL